MSAHGPRADRRDVRILLVDDHRMLLEMLSSVLAREQGMSVVGAVTSLQELAELDADPDVVLIDYMLPDGTGVEGCYLVRSRWPAARIVVLTGLGTEEVAMATVKAGADGFLAKNGDLKEVIEGVRAVAEHRTWIPTELLGRMARGLTAPRPSAPLIEPLTPRELMTLKALARGLSTINIAKDMGISQGTVRRHVEALRRKFGVRSKLEVVSAALQHGIVELVPFQGSADAATRPREAPRSRGAAR